MKYIKCIQCILWAFQVVLVVKNPPAYAGDIRDAGSIPGLGRSPGGGYGNPLQYSCLENPMDRGAWWAMVHRLAKSQTWLKHLIMHTMSFTYDVSLKILSTDLGWGRGYSMTLMSNFTQTRSMFKDSEDFYETGFLFLVSMELYFFHDLGQVTLSLTNTFCLWWWNWSKTVRV